MRLAAALVRAWTAVYTRGVPDAERRARRDEIESDLWESSHGDPPVRAAPIVIIGRLIRGVPDDLGWRWERGTSRPLAFVGAAAAVFAIAVIALAVWAGSAQTLPKPMPLESRMRAERPPPPPPPPPCPPAGSGYAAPASCTPLR